MDGAQEKTRTSTVLPPPGPEPGASTNFATWASQEGAILTRFLDCCKGNYFSPVADAPKSGASLAATGAAAAAKPDAF
jgi:hypothetical protein